MNDIKSKKNPPDIIQLYQETEAIYPRSFKGFYRNIRIIGAGFLFLLYFGTVWLSLNNQPIILFDLPARKFHIFGSVFWPQDFILLSCLLAICAFGLFTITVLAGRVWCGYTCPQSVFTWVFLWIEKITEGDRNKRKQLDLSKFSVNKAFKKLTKHSLWLIVSFITAITFVGYFVPIRDLIRYLYVLEASTWTIFWLAFFTIATYLNAGWIREKVCLHMCPYARFQSVMFDNDTLIVAYNEDRGENRGSRKKSELDYKEQGLGDCIDCKLCVQVCPTGIDIRNGLQLSCIGCAACVDACDNVMEKMGYQPGLVSYTSENQLINKHKNFNWFRPKLIGYLISFLIMCSVLLWSINYRPLLEMEVMKDRNVLFRITKNNDIANDYIIKLINKSKKRQEISISYSGIPNLMTDSKKKISIESGEIVEKIVELSILKDQFINNQDITITATMSPDSQQSYTVESKVRFLGPM